MTRTKAKRQAKAAAERAVPGKTFRATITGDDILDVSCAANLSAGESRALEKAVARLGWRGWSIGLQGIAFKPTARLDMD